MRCDACCCRTLTRSLASLRSCSDSSYGRSLALSYTKLPDMTSGIPRGTTETKSKSVLRDSHFHQMLGDNRLYPVSEHAHARARHVACRTHVLRHLTRQETLTHRHSIIASIGIRGEKCLT